MEKFYCISVDGYKFDCLRVSENIYYCPSQHMDFFRHGNGKYSKLDNVRSKLDDRMRRMMEVPFWEMGRCQVDGKVQVFADDEIEDIL